MRLDSLGDVGTETQIVLRTAIGPGEMHEEDGTDNVSMPTVIEKAHQNGTFSVSTM